MSNSTPPFKKCEFSLVGTFLSHQKVLKYKNTSSRDFRGPTKRCLTETTHFNGTKCYRVRLLMAMSSWLRQFSYKSKCWMAFIFSSRKRTIFSFFDISTVQWHFSVVAIWLIFLKYKNTSYMDFWKHFFYGLPRFHKGVFNRNNTL